MSRDKDTGQCIQLLSSIFAPATEMYFVQATYWRAATVLELAQWVHGCNSGSNADVSNNANNNIIPAEKLAAFGGNNFLPSYFTFTTVHIDECMINRCTANPPARHFRFT